MYGNNAFNVYKNNSVNYASNDQLLLMLLDGAVKFTKIAREGIIEKNIAKSHENLIKVQNIFTELMVTLDQSAGQWAKDIYKVYEFIKSTLVTVNIKKDLDLLDEVMPIIESVRDTWNEAFNKAKGIRK